MNSRLFSVRKLLKAFILYILLLTCFGAQRISTVQAQEASGSTRTLVQVSVSPTGQPGNGPSIGGSISSDGHYIVFHSFASNLVEGDTNGDWDVFVRDLRTGTTFLVSVDSNGNQGNESSYVNFYSPGGRQISADGRYIAFYSNSNNLVTGDTNNRFDVFIHDMLTGDTNRVSVDSDGHQANGDSEDPSISTDGRYVVFKSYASNLVTGDSNFAYDIFVHDRQTGQTELISKATNGTQANKSSDRATISGDGRFVVFDSMADNLVPSATFIAQDVFLRDRQLGTTSVASVSSDGTRANNSSLAGVVSLDGRYVAFSSDANNLIDHDTNDFVDVFVHDMQTGSTIRVSVGAEGQQGNQPSWISAITPDGRHVLFGSASSNFVTGDANTYTDGFVYDMIMGSTTRVTLGSAGQEVNGASHPWSITDDMRSVAFWSEANNLMPDQTDFIEDVYVTFEWPVFALSINKGGDGNGTVTSDPVGINCGSSCGYSFQVDSIVSLTAAGSPGSTFSGWTGAIISTDNPLSVTMNTEKVLTANFTLEEYELTITSDHGTIVKSPDQPTYHYGEVVELSATPDVDYGFLNWSGDASGSANPIHITIQGDTNITANYLQYPRTLTITSDHGTVTKSPDQAVYQDGDVVQLSVAPTPGYSFDHWSGDFTGTDNPTNVTISGDMAITANYSLNDYTLTIISVHGNVTKSPDQATYHYGDIVHLSAVPDSDYHFTSWSGDASGTSNPINITIQRNTSLTANFVLNSYTLSVFKTGSGSGTVTSSPAGINCGADCSHTYAAGTLVTLTAVPDADAPFTGWAGSPCPGTDPCTLELHANAKITANFGSYLVYWPYIKKSLPLPGAFNKTQPANGSINLSLDQSLYWNSSTGAVSYEWCLDETNNNTCNTSWHNNGLSQGVAVWYFMTLKYNTTYYWQVRALNGEGYSTQADGGTWWSFETKWKPKAGLWFDDYHGTYFFVTPDQDKVSGFTIPVNFPCGLYWITRPIPDYDISIVHDNHSFTGYGYLSAAGTFDSKTVAHGVTWLSGIGPICGYYWDSDPWPWNAVWIDDSQPTAMSAQAKSISETSAIQSILGSGPFKTLPVYKAPAPIQPPARR